MDADLAAMPVDDKDKTDAAGAEMEVDAEGKDGKELETAPEKEQDEKKDEIQADDDDAVEY